MTKELKNKIKQTVREMISNPGTKENEDFNIKTFTDYILNLFDDEEKRIMRKVIDN